MHHFPICQETLNRLPHQLTMNSKICFVALFAVVVTSFAPASAQPLRVCEPACGGQYSDQNVYIATCCQQEGHTSEDAFDKCCASSCSTSSPCKYENLGSSGGDILGTSA
ncbi:hypothetical protein PC114_g13210 [Phytophthora cactorum]|uniref:Phytotoxin PcF domain-containing protein n=2 Tax=Phytophthora cactorum TaxID=29920 RepID=A0A8T1D207_9STRA|nr:hypothetical protein PC114_g13210 [Phytophthora cactorum]KAG2933348.1 hypothetical protein PC117_g12888 [Phytophthora cactorum]KAG3016853.1 hypothetical protein PC120_g11385 [Phytophthora cactorum]